MAEQMQALMHDGLAERDAQLHLAHSQLKAHRNAALLRMHARALAAHLRQGFEAWLRLHRDRRHVRNLAYQLSSRMRHANLESILKVWRYRCKEQAVAVRRAGNAQRKLARHRLAAAFAAWRSSWQVASTIEQRVDALALRRSALIRARAFSVWRSSCQVGQMRSAVLSLVHSQRAFALTNLAFQSWESAAAQQQRELVLVSTPFGRAQRSRTLRSVFRAWRTRCRWCRQLDAATLAQSHRAALARSLAAWAAIVQPARERALLACLLERQRGRRMVTGNFEHWRACARRQVMCRAKAKHAITKIAYRLLRKALASLQQAVAARHRQDAAIARLQQRRCDRTMRMTWRRWHAGVDQTRECAAAAVKMASRACIVSQRHVMQHWAAHTAVLVHSRSICARLARTRRARSLRAAVRDWYNVCARASVSEQRAQQCLRRHTRRRCFTAWRSYRCSAVTCRGQAVVVLKQACCTSARKIMHVWRLAAAQLRSSALVSCSLQKQRTTRLLSQALDAWTIRAAACRRHSVAVRRCCNARSRRLQQQCLHAWQACAHVGKVQRVSVQRVCRTGEARRLRAAFVLWVRVTAAAEEARGRVRRCVGAKRIAQAAFKTWFSSHLEHDVSHVRASALCITLSAAAFISLTVVVVIASCGVRCGVLDCRS